MTAILAFAAAMSLAQAAPPTQLSSHDPATLVRFLQDEGYKAKLTKDRQGDPMIESADGGSNFAIMFYNCKDHRACEDLQFNTAYDYEDGPPSLSAINQWNAENRFSRAYMDKESDPVLEMDVIFTKGAMGREMFGEHLTVFLDSMGRFEKHIGWGETETEQPEPTAASSPLALSR